MKFRKSIVALVVAAGIATLSGNTLAVGSIADIRIFDRAENRQLPVYWHHGKAYVIGKPGNEYQISVLNRAGADVLAVVSVDGVNVVSGETAAPHQTGYVLRHGMHYDVRGWRKSLSRTAAFYFTRLPDSYAARTGRPDNVGVIGVAVFRRKPATPPAAIGSLGRQEDSRRMASADEAQGAAASGTRENRASPEAPRMQAQDAPERGARGDARSEAESHQADAARDRRSQRKIESSLGTGHGRNETSNVRNVAFERATPYPEEVVTIYYDSYNNLLARGIVAPTPVARPKPQPFPGGFVADPPRG